LGLIFVVTALLKFGRHSLLTAAVLLAYGCGSAPEDAAASAMGGRGGPVPVITAPVVETAFSDAFSALGSVRASEAVEIRARISSVVTSIHFADGQQVAKGALLVQLDDREIAAELAVAEAALQKVSSQYDRSASLRQTQVVSEAELEELAADVKKAEADVAAARARLDHCSIDAPIAGIVGLRNVSPGGLVGPDMIITTLDDTRTVKLQFAIPETFLAAVSQGMQVAASTAVYPDESFSGIVTSIDSRIDPATRSIKVVASIPNPDSRLKPGMFMTVDLQRSRDSVLLIPEQALAPRAGRQYVFVVSDAVATEHEVSLGVRAPGVVEITDGLQAGDQVIIEGIQKVRSGSAVSIQQSDGL